MTALESQSARYLLQNGKSVRKSLNRVLKGAHRAGFLVLPRRGTVVAVACPRDADPSSAALTQTADPSGAVHRRTWRFDLDYRDYPRGSVVLEASLLHYPGKSSFDAVEFSLGLRQGPPQLLERVLAIVALESALIPARLSDAERLAVAAGLTASASRSAPGHHLGLESRWQDLGLAHLKALTAQLHQYEPRAWESLEAEGVHQMRVTARRLREVLRAFGPVLPPTETAELADDLRWLGGLLGAVRDLDVQIERLAGWEAAAIKRGKANTVLPRYHRHLQARQRRAHRALVAALGDPRYLDIVRNVQALVTRALATEPTTDDPTIARAGAEVLDKLLRRVLRNGRRALAQCNAERLHRLRIDAKRLRYCLEYVAPIGGPAIAAGIESLNRLQDILGEHQDAWVACESLAAWRRSAILSGSERRRLRRLDDAQTRKVRAARNAFRAEWPAFASASRTLVLC